jgi:methylmalonyl-CoA mutase
LKLEGRSDILVVVGGVIPKQDYAFLNDQGVFGIYGPGTVLATAAQEILLLLISSHN